MIFESELQSKDLFYKKMLLHYSSSFFLIMELRMSVLKVDKIMAFLAVYSNIFWDGKLKWVNLACKLIPLSMLASK